MLVDCRVGSLWPTLSNEGFPGGLVVKNSLQETSCNAEDSGLITES